MIQRSKKPTVAREGVAPLTVPVMPFWLSPRWMSLWRKLKAQTGQFAIFFDQCRHLRGNSHSKIIKFAGKLSDVRHRILHIGNCYLLHLSSFSYAGHPHLKYFMLLSARDAP